MTRTSRVAAVVALAALIAVAASGAPDRVQTASGNVSRLDAAARTVVVTVSGQDMRFVWNSETKINGVLAPGARVTIRYSSPSEGENVAHQISVARS
jgi:hypothetical protein